MLLSLNGETMAPVFIENDIVIVKKQDNCENNDFAVVSINGAKADIKKIKKTDTGLILQPINFAYEPIMYTYEEIKTIPVTILGIVKQLKRDFF